MGSMLNLSNLLILETKCFTFYLICLCFTHGCMPAGMMETIIVPIIKKNVGILLIGIIIGMLQMPLLYPSFLSVLFYLNARNFYTHVIISLDFNLSTVQNYVFIHQKSLLINNVALLYLSLYMRESYKG